jgi:hypothetical protein
VTAGDQLTIDWETQEKLMLLQMFAIGTTDFTFLTTSPLIEQSVNINFKEQATYTATQTGILPAEFKSDTGCSGAHTAPYNFTASVLHAVVLSLPTLSTLPTSGAIAVGVHNPDGVPINDPSLLVGFNVEISGASSFTAVGTAPAVNGIATIAYSLPSGDAGQSVTIQAVSSGAAYLPGNSSTEIVTVPKPPPPPPPCVVPAFHRGATLASVEQKLRATSCSVGAIRYTASTTVRRGGVIGLSPGTGTKMAAGAAVSIVVSAGRPCVVPVVRAGATLSHAEHLLAAADCRAVVVHAHSRHVRRGHVVGLGSRAHTRLFPLSRVRVVISAGR